MLDPFAFVFGSAWGTFTLLTWGLVLRGRWRMWRKHRDRRAKRELLFVAPLWGISMLWGIVLFFSAIRDVADVGVVVRGLLFGFGIGMYTLAGLMGAFGSRRKDE